MAVYSLTINIANIQAEKAVVIAFTDGVATWSISAPSSRIAGLAIESVPAGELLLARFMIDETTLTYTAGSSAGSLVIDAHVALPDGMTMATGSSNTGGDTNVAITWANADGAIGELLGDWTIPLTESASVGCD